MSACQQRQQSSTKNLINHQSEQAMAAISEQTADIAARL
jgi:hypothetical protein